MSFIRKPSISLLAKIFVLLGGCIFLGKMTSTVKTIPWLAIFTGYTSERTEPEDVNFTLVAPSLQPRLPAQEIFLLVLVSTAPGVDYHFARTAIRRTWGNRDKCGSTDGILNERDPCRWRVVFMVGKIYNELLDSQIMDEAQLFNDILVGNFHDTYVNLVIKLFMGFAWATKVNCRFVLKADDDVYVRLPKLVSWLHHTPSRLYAGHVHTMVDVSRDPNERNALPRGSSFNEKYYPPYCLGAFYVLSRSVIPDMLKAANRWRPWPIEDTYISVLARDVGVSPTDIYGFVLTARASKNLPHFRECDWTCTIALGHRLTPSHLLLVHNKFESLSSFDSSNCTADTCSNVGYTFYFSFLVVCILVFVAALLTAYAWLRKKQIISNTQWLFDSIKWINI